MSKVRIPDKVPVQQLLRHMEKYYTDWHINKELDTITIACISDRAVNVVKKYARLRRNSKGFRPTLAFKSNDNQVPKIELVKLHKRAVRVDKDDTTDGQKQCRVCRNFWKPKRSDATICSQACRKRGSRARTKVLASQCQHDNTLADCPELWCSNRREDLPNVVGPIPENVS